MKFAESTNREEEMSMEDILTSIRKYVSEENERNDTNKVAQSANISSTSSQMPPSTQSDPQPPVSEPVIKLNESNVIYTGQPQQSETPLREQDMPKISPQQDNRVIYQEKSSLSASLVTEPPQEVPSKKKVSPFEQLTNALNAYGKPKPEPKPHGVTVDQLFSCIAEKVVQKWIDDHMKDTVERMIAAEIEKMKSE